MYTKTVDVDWGGNMIMQMDFTLSLYHSSPMGSQNVPAGFYISLISPLYKFPLEHHLHVSFLFRLLIFPLPHSVNDFTFHFSEKTDITREQHSHLPSLKSPIYLYLILQYFSSVTVSKLFLLILKVKYLPCTLDFILSKVLKGLHSCNLISLPLLYHQFFYCILISLQTGCNTSHFNTFLVPHPLHMCISSPL